MHLCGCFLAAATVLLAIGPIRHQVTSHRVSVEKQAQQMSRIKKLPASERNALIRAATRPIPPHLPLVCSVVAEISVQDTGNWALHGTHPGTAGLGKGDSDDVAAVRGGQWLLTLAVTFACGATVTPYCQTCAQENNVGLMLKYTAFRKVVTQYAPVSACVSACVLILCVGGVCDDTDTAPP